MWSPAQGDVNATAACIQVAERSQALRADGKLDEARAALTACSREQCPAVIRRDCAGWMAEVLAAQPTVVFAARGEGDHDLIAVQVMVDGALVAKSLDGRAMPVDPGRHVVRMEAAGYVSREDVVLLREGDKDRQLVMTLSSLLAVPKVTPSIAPPLAPVAKPVDRPARPIPLATYVSAALGVGALGMATYFDIKATSGALSLKDSCGNHCAASEIDPLHTDYRVAQVAFGVGVVALGAAVLFFVLRPHAPDQVAAAAPARRAY